MKNNEYAIQLHGSDIIKLSGNVTFTNAVKIRREGEKLISSMPRVNIDLADLKKIDSSCLAVLVCWIRYARAKDKIILLNNLTEKLLNLSKVSGLDIILPIG